jgi:hypothetical protein
VAEPEIIMTPRKIAACTAVTAVVLGGTLTAATLSRSHVVRQAAPARIVYLTRTPPPQVITRWRTKTITKTVSVPAVPSGDVMSCWIWSGGVTVLDPPQTQASTPAECQVSRIGPSSASEFQAIAPSGATTTFTVSAP